MMGFMDDFLHYKYFTLREVLMEEFSVRE